MRPRFLSPERRRLRTGLVVAGILALALGFRLWGLEERGIWLDETVSLDVAARSPGEIARGQVFDNHTPPLYYLLLHLWLRIVPESLFTLRLLSVLLDLAVVGLLAATVARSFGRWPALAVAAAYAMAPFAVRLAQEGRMYPLLVLLVVASYALALELACRRDRAWPAVALVPVAAAALYTHYYAAFSLLTLHGVMAWQLRKDRRACLRWWAGMAGAGLLFVPWLPVVAELLGVGGQYFRSFGMSVVPYAFLRFAVGFSLLPVTVAGKMDLASALASAWPPLAIVAVGVGGVALGGVVRALPRVRSGGGGGCLGSRTVGRVTVSLVVVPPLLAALVSWFAPSLDVRYLAVCFPFFLVLVVLGLGIPVGGGDAGEGGREGRPRPVRAVAGATLRLIRGLAILVFLAGAGAQLLDPDAGTTPWRAAVAELHRLEPGGATVWVRPDAHARVLRRHLGRGCPGHSVAGGPGTTGWCVLPGVEATGPPDEMSRDVPEDRGSMPLGVSGDVATAQPRWLVEVEYLARDQPFVDPAWEVRSHRLFLEGNGVRISRLVPRSILLREGTASGGSVNPPPPSAP